MILRWFLFVALFQFKNDKCVISVISLYAPSLFSGIDCDTWYGIVSRCWQLRNMIFFADIYNIQLIWHFWYVNMSMVNGDEWYMLVNPQNWSKVQRRILLLSIAPWRERITPCDHMSHLRHLFAVRIISSTTSANDPPMFGLLLLQLLPHVGQALVAHLLGFGINSLEFCFLLQNSILSG